MSDRVWYAAYGSNLLEERFARYLVGGRYGTAGREHHGARDRTLPADWRVMSIQHQLCFGQESARWGGGVAFLDPAPDSGQAWVRCWDVSTEQFSDVAAQENGLEPGDLAIDVTAVVEHGYVDVTPRWYGRALYLGLLDDRPVVTFTSPARPEPNAPGRPYLEVVARGLHDCGALIGAAVAEYLHSCPGVVGAWPLDALRGLSQP